jgi:hypothetical protein
VKQLSKNKRYKTSPIKCVSCGQFISYKDLYAGMAVEDRYEPDNAFGPEICEFIHIKCRQKERDESQGIRR